MEADYKELAIYLANELIESIGYHETLNKLIDCGLDNETLITEFGFDESDLYEDYDEEDF